MRQTGICWTPDELGYCSNVHYGDTYDELLANITCYINRVRQSRHLEHMATGLWISADAAQSLNTDHTLLEGFRDTLAESHLDLITLNGFPYGNFHAASVKETVYFPDWSEKKRYDYTVTLAELLSRTLPDAYAEGTISTLPLGFGHGWSQQKHEAACQRICRLAETLDRIRTNTGKTLRVCFEMEPDCVLETTGQIVDFFNNDLQEAADRERVPHHIIYEHLGICYDICHQAVMFEGASDSLQKIRDANIIVGKIQISSALHVSAPSAHKTRAALAEYAEPKYLHQVRTCDEHGQLAGAMDLGPALKDTTLPTNHPWRVHFHIPVQAASLDAGLLATTREEISEVLDFISDNPDMRPHLEVETYTWNALPVDLRPHDDNTLINGLTQELKWLEKEMDARGLLESDNES